MLWRQAMKNHPIALAALAALAAVGCTAPWAKQNSTPYILEIADISGSSGPGSTLNSDVFDRRLGVVNDNATVAVNIFRKNNSSGLGVSPVEHIYLRRYEVRFFRTDGRNIPGVDVPYGFSGPLDLRFHTPGPGGD